MKLTDIILKEDSHGGDYEKNNIKLMGDVILPIDKQMVLQAEEDTYNRGLLVTNNKDKSYDVAYWAGKFEPYPIEVEIDGKSVSKDAKKIKLLFHPEMDESLKESTSLSEPSEEMEKVINAGIRSNYDDIDSIRDVMYYVHNNWMENEISAQEAMKKISKYLDPR
tara:strand:+ start:226 stop:720 length:495 start_codon:yes stop_codon:yes gene_type:complete